MLLLFFVFLWAILCTHCWNFPPNVFFSAFLFAFFAVCAAHGFINYLFIWLLTRSPSRSCCFCWFFALARCFPICCLIVAGSLLPQINQTFDSNIYISVCLWIYIHLSISLWTPLLVTLSAHIVFFSQWLHLWFMPRKMRYFCFLRYV